MKNPTLINPNLTLSDESKEKVCIITDIVAMERLLKKPIPDVKLFDTLYGMSIAELELYQYTVLRAVSEIPELARLKKDIIQDWDGTHTEF